MCGTRSRLPPLARRRRPRAGQDRRLCSWSSPRCDIVVTYAGAPRASAASSTSPSSSSPRLAGRDLGARAGARRDRAPRRRATPKRRSATPSASSACWSASPSSRSRSSSSSTISASTSPPWSPASASAASPSASPPRAFSPTCSRRSRSSSTSRSAAATPSATDTTTGTVERIGLKTTRLRSLTGEQVIMANTKLLENEIHNLADGGSAPADADLRARLPDAARRACRARRVARPAVEAAARLQAGPLRPDQPRPERHRLRMRL